MSNADNPEAGPGAGDAAAGLALIEAAIAESPDPRPVGSWSPAHSRELDIRIASDGTWHYLGSPIGRKRLVQLFASVLWRDQDGRHYLVTPHEKIAIIVDDAPFVAVHMDVAGTDETQVLGFRTDVGDYVKAGPQQPLQFVLDAATGGMKPYVEIRNGLVALVSRAVTYDLMELGVIAARDGEPWFGIWSSGMFFPIVRESDLA
jgi:hypothetical protein